MSRKLHSSKSYPAAAILAAILFSAGSITQADAQCTPRALPFTENFSGTPFAACTPTVGGWHGTDVASGAGWWLPATNYAGGTVPEVEGYGDQANGGVSETIYLISPALNTTGASELSLSFNHSLYLHNSAASGSPGIQIKVEFSEDSVNWNYLYDGGYSATQFLTNVVTENRTLPISGITGNKVYIRFSVNGVLFKLWGWEIDDINVTVSSSTQVPVFTLTQQMIYQDHDLGKIRINLSGAQHAEAALFDVLGNVIYRSGIFNNTHSIDVGALSKGIYFVKLRNETGAIAKKIILD